MRLKTILIAFIVTTVLSTSGFAVEYYLRADYTTKTMPDDSNAIPMWGFAVDSGFGALDGQVTVPGPLLTVPVGDSNLIIHLDNNLNVPISIVINGQNAIMAPVRNPDGRVRSFTHETEPNNSAPVDYIWANFKPGTYIYQSGTHPAVQVQMGLYGGITKDFGVGQVYQDVNYIKQVPLFFSEIDPILHNAVATGNYGPGKAMTSTIDYKPKYFLINGQAYSQSSTPVIAGRTNQKILLRFFNIGIETRSPLLQGLYMKSVAEDGYPYKYPKESYTLPLTAAKTIDAVITSPTIGRFPLYDRRLALTNVAQSPGGMLIYLDITYNPDFNNDQFVNLLDYAILAGEFGRTDCSPANPCQADLNTDGQVNTVDLALLVEWWLQNV